MSVRISHSPSPADGARSLVMTVPVQIECTALVWEHHGYVNGVKVSLLHLSAEKRIKVCLSECSWYKNRQKVLLSVVLLFHKLFFPVDKKPYCHTS